MTQKLNHSGLKAFRACQRLHQLSYVRGYKPVREGAALAFGLAIHEALAGWWSTGPAGAYELAVAQLPALPDPFARARAEVMIAAYDAFWRDEGYEALAVEKEFSLPLLNPLTNAASRTWHLGGTVDGIVRAPDGRVWVLEHKTTSQDPAPGSVYRRRLAIDGQVSQYIEGARALGFDVAGVIYDVLVKPAHKPYLATPVDARKYTKAGALYTGQRARDESVDEYRERVAEAVMSEPHRYFQRVEVVRLESEREEYLYDVWRYGELMRDSLRTGIAPRNPDACERYGGVCPFFDVCTGSASLDDQTRFVRDTPEPIAASAA